MKQGKYIEEYDCIVYPNGEIMQNGKKRTQFLSGGYMNVKLKIENRFTNIRVHRLVALAFVPNPEQKQCVDHIDGVKTHNTPDNLRWCTIAENTAFDNFIKKPKIYKVKRIDKDGNETIFDDVLEACREPWEKYLILQCCRGKRKTVYGYKWEFTE